MNQWNPWAESEDEVVRANPRMRLKELSAILGRTPNAIHKRRIVLGVAAHRRPWTPAERARCVELHRLGWGRTAIARSLRRSPASVSFVLCREGATSRGNP